MTRKEFFTFAIYQVYDIQGADLVKVADHFGFNWRRCGNEVFNLYYNMKTQKQEIVFEDRNNEEIFRIDSTELYKYLKANKPL